MFFLVFKASNDHECNTRSDAVMSLPLLSLSFHPRLTFVACVFCFDRKRLNELAQGLDAYSSNEEEMREFVHGRKIFIINVLLTVIHIYPYVNENTSIFSR